MALNIPCALISATVGTAVNLLLDLEAKFASLEVAVLQLRASLEVVPVLPALPAISAVTPAIYLSLGAACPSFSLPGISASISVPGAAQIAALQASVLGAYNSTLNSLESSALGAIGQLQAQLNRLVASALAAVKPFMGMIGCICGGDPLTVSALQAQAFYNKIVATPLTLLDTALVAQIAMLNAAKSQLIAAIGAPSIAILPVF